MLFEGTSLDNYNESLWSYIVKEIDSYSNEKILTLDAVAVGIQVASKRKIECPSLCNEYSIDEVPFQPNLNSVPVTIYIPFTGTKDLFSCNKGGYPHITESVKVQEGQLVVQMNVLQRELPNLKSRVDSLVKQIETGLAPMRCVLHLYQKSLEERAAHRIRERQDEIARHSHVVSQMANIGIPIRKREDAKHSAFVPVKAKRIEFVPQPAPSKPAEKATPQYEISLTDYDEILRVIQNMVKVFERSPSVFKGMEEEDLRTILLVGLNGIFEGAATGETFNGIGKTDILIRAHNDNIFIAECLIWGGPEHFRKKLTEQLFGYSTWRDSKLAAIIFNRNKDFTSVVSKMKDTVEKLGNCKGKMTYEGATVCRHQFVREDDPQKKFVLTCLAFEVPS